MRNDTPLPISCYSLRVSPSPHLTPQVDENLPIIVVATKDGMHKKMDSVIQQLLARAAKLYIVCNEGDEGMKAYEQQGCQLIKVRGAGCRGGSP